MAAELQTLQKLSSNLKADSISSKVLQTTFKYSYQVGIKDTNLKIVGEAVCPLQVMSKANAEDVGVSTTIIILSTRYSKEFCFSSQTGHA